MPEPTSSSTTAEPAPSDGEDRFASHQSFRAGLVTDLRRQLFGPTQEDGEASISEVLTVSPLQLYATGVLFPQKLVQELLEADRDAPSQGADEGVEGDLGAAEVREGKRSAGGAADQGSTSDEREPLNLANEFSPSACGISFRLKKPAALVVKVTYGTYQPTKQTERHPRAGQPGMDGRPIPETRDVAAYRRTHHSHEHHVDVGKKLGSLDPIVINSADPELKLHVTVRSGREGSLVVSAMAVNHRSCGGALPSNEDAYFQVALQVAEREGAPIFLPIDRDTGEQEDAELASLELLYRHRRAFALGHGVAGDWNRSEALSLAGSTDRVCSAALPTYELQPIKPREKGFRSADLRLSMEFLAGGGGSAATDEILAALREMAADYLDWIEDVEVQAAGFEPTLRKAATANLANCRTCHSRMVEGIDTLRADPQAMLAFRLMNRAMLVQQFHSSLPHRKLGSDFPKPPEGYRHLPHGKGNWRPFQLAFILMNVAGMTDPDHPERKLVDLIWFPTGGGKTEAYLGLAAYTIAMVRMGGAAPGVTVLMRYTLRLLTAQQFQRAAALVLALEMLRRDRTFGVDLGREEISIGLWVGESLSPNKRADAKAALDKLKRDKFAPNPFQVLQCPWCGVEFTEQTKLGYQAVRARDTNERSVRFVCPDDSCSFSGAGLPVLVVDEELYSAPPTILIGTVDKFAQISWDNRVGRLFGLGTAAPPPALVIQDELHLISGPLGTVVGLYETAIDRMCSRDDHVHKLVASTATIRRAAQQCRDLYARQAFEFPPQAIRAGESYFAYEDTEGAGRLYVGFMGTAVKSHQTALVRACSPLLQSVNVPVDEEDERKRAIVDPYGTLVWYFNSLRELGHAATLSVGDIPEFLKGLRHRLGIPYEDSRYLREIVELTSRCNADEIPSILQQLEIPWRRNPQGPSPVDVLLATNMIAVGVDVPRLGLFVMSGQPKSTSEYIQATSRVGRRHPGLVVTVYTQTKSRDRSHYERFVAYHQSLYRHVEPTSVTPFSPQARERGMRGVLVALARQLAGVLSPDQISDCEDAVLAEVAAILDRIRLIDEREVDEAEQEIDQWLAFWADYAPPEYGRMGGKPAESTLAYPFGSNPDPDFQREAWPIPTSMRNVDGTSEAMVLNVYQVLEIDAEDA